MQSIRIAENAGKLIGIKISIAELEATVVRLQKERDVMIRFMLAEKKATGKYLYSIPEIADLAGVRKKIVSDLSKEVRAR